ncbi:hypothetical protein GGI21_001771, partial [Coemansia aciculifera]
MLVAPTGVFAVAADDDDDDVDEEDSPLLDDELMLLLSSFWEEQLESSVDFTDWTLAKPPKSHEPSTFLWLLYHSVMTQDTRWMGSQNEYLPYLPVVALPDTVLQSTVPQTVPKMLDTVVPNVAKSPALVGTVVDLLTQVSVFIMHEQVLLEGIGGSDELAIQSLETATAGHDCCLPLGV